MARQAAITGQLVTEEQDSVEHKRGTGDPHPVAGEAPPRPGSLQRDERLLDVALAIGCSPGSAGQPSGPASAMVCASLAYSSLPRPKTVDS